MSRFNLDYSFVHRNTIIGHSEAAMFRTKGQPSGGGWRGGDAPVFTA